MTTQPGGIQPAKSSGLRRGAGGLSPRTATRLAWSACGLSITLTALSLLLLTLNLSYPGIRVFDAWSEYAVSATTFSVVGAIIASRCPTIPIGWIFCGIGIIGGVRHLSAQYATYTLLALPGSLPAGEALAWAASWLWVFYLGLFVFLGLLFPDGRLPSGRWRWVAWASAAVVLMGATSVAFSPGPVHSLDPKIQNPLGMVGAYSTVRAVLTLLYVLGLAMAISLFVRLRHAKGVERQQLKWFAYTVAVAISGAIPKFVVFPVTGVPAAWVSWVSSVLTMVGLVGIPIAIGIAIFKYRLYDIDLIINRTLVYVALSAIVVGIYMLVVAGLGTLFVGGLGTLLQGTSYSLTISLFATGLVSILFHPLRNRLQRGVNHLMYGERTEPYEVLSRLRRRLEATLVPDAVLTTIVETIAQALKLPYAAILLKQGDGFVAAAEYGTLVGEVTTLPLVHRREPVGLLVVAPRTPGEVFEPSDKRLLEDLAWQAGSAAQAVRLTADLKRSRERLVTAREEERRRLRRDLHDGLGPMLGSLTLGLDVARRTLPKGASTTEELLAELKAQTQEAVSDIRRLAHGLRPPALDDLGLVPAIRQQAAKHGRLRDDPSASMEGKGNEGGVSFLVDAEKNLPPLPAAVEVACYRITQEAITNVSRHARAGFCRIRLAVDVARDALVLEIADDGVGIPNDRHAGVGMNSMRERAEELDGTFVAERNPEEGGTRVLASLPLSAKEE